MASKADQVRGVMKQVGGFSDKELSNITEELIAEMEQNAKTVPEGTFEEGAKPMSQVWTGNNFTLSGGYWYWQDQPGSQCGRTRWWQYSPRNGDSYAQGGSCPQGYVWYRLDIMH